METRDNIQDTLKSMSERELWNARMHTCLHYHEQGAEEARAFIDYELLRRDIPMYYREVYCTKNKLERLAACGLNEPNGGYARKEPA